MASVNEDETHNAADVVREEIELLTSNLGGAMMGIADSYMELAYGAGKDFGVHAHYRQANLHTGKPQAELAVELAAWASEIVMKASTLDAKREALQRLEAEGITPKPVP